MVLQRLALAVIETFTGAWLAMLIIGWFSSFIDGLPALGYWHTVVVVVLVWFLGGALAGIRREFE